ncbi:MAG: hypothetical protein L0229_13665, partial [Blastocatellia bacterium]|nr:hypothetical protein [Blastocatellia bacterium]
GAKGNKRQSYHASRITHHAGEQESGVGGQGLARLHLDEKSLPFETRPLGDERYAQPDAATIQRRPGFLMMGFAIGAAVVVIATVVAIILALWSNDTPAPIAKTETQTATPASPAEEPSKPAAPAPMVEAMSYYLELERAGSRSIRSAGAEPIDENRRFRVHFTPRERGYLYIIAPGEGDVPTIFLTAEPVAAKADYQFPPGNNWIRARSTEETINFTIVFSPVPLRAPTFLASPVGRKLAEADLKELRASATGVKIETESSRAAVRAPVSTEEGESAPLVFDIIIKRR